MLAFAAGISLTASTDARANADMNSSLTLCFFSIWPLNLARIIYKRGHVDLVEGRERCRGVVRLLSGLGDAQAHAVHLHARFVPAARRSERRREFGFQFLWSRRGWAGLVSVFGEGGVSFRVSGGGGEVSLGFSTAWSPAFFGSSGTFLSWGLAAVSVGRS